MPNAEVLQESFELVGYGPAPGNGIAQVTRYDRAGRWRRAFKGLATWWGAGFVGAFIPLAHLLLVPGFGLAGLISFAHRLRTLEVAHEVRGTCPDCALEQAFDGGRGWSLPFEVSCAGCHRTLTARKTPAT